MGGVSAAVLSAGKTNIRAYSFDLKGRYLFCLYTQKDKVEIAADALAKAKAIQPAMVKFATDHLSGFELNLLNTLGTYKRGSHAFTEAQLSRRTYGGMEWSSADHLSGTMHIAWAGKKPVMRIRTVENGGWARNQGYRIEDAQIYDLS